MLVGTFEHLVDGEVLITDPAADTSKGNGVNNRVFGLPSYQLVQVRFWLPAGVYEIWKEDEGHACIIKKGMRKEDVSARTHQGRVSSAFTRWLSLVDLSEYYCNKYFDQVEAEYVSFDPDSFLRICKKRGLVLSPSFELSLRKQADARSCPFVSELVGSRQIACAKSVANNSWYMYIVSLLESDNNGCVSYSGFTALSTCGEVYDVYGVYDSQGPCGIVVESAEPVYE